MEMLRIPVFAGAFLISVAAIGLAPAWAQSSPAPADATTASHNAAHHQMTPKLTHAQLVDGRIAFLKTELKITPAQEAQWRQVAAALRQNAHSLDEATAARPHRGAAMNAIERLEQRSAFAKLRADNDARLLAAFKPLYASLSPDQQHTANALMVGHHGWRHGWHHRA